MKTPEELTELQQSIASQPAQAALCSSEIVSLRQQVENLKSIADTIDNSLGHPQSDETPDKRIRDQLCGLLHALSEAKRQQANAAGEPQPPAGQPKR